MIRPVFALQGIGTSAGDICHAILAYRYSIEQSKEAL
jgi:hypothetical protein